jgi:hypothetical protein
VDSPITAQGACLSSFGQTIFPASPSMANSGCPRLCPARSRF